MRIKAAADEEKGVGVREREGGNDVSRAFYSMDFDETVLSLCGLRLYESDNTLINSYIPIKRKCRAKF